MTRFGIVAHRCSVGAVSPGPRKLCGGRRSGGLGDRGDLAAARQAAGEADIGAHEDRHVARDSNSSNSQIELSRSPIAIGASMRSAISACVSIESIWIGSSMNSGMELRERVADDDRLGGVELAVQLEDQVDLVPAGLARRGRHRAGDDQLADRQVFVAVHERIELDRGEALLGRPVDRRADLVRSAAADEDVQTHAVARAPAEQLPDRQPERLALDVPAARDRSPRRPRRAGCCGTGAHGRRGARGARCETGRLRSAAASSSPSTPATPLG